MDRVLSAGQRGVLTTPGCASEVIGQSKERTAIESGGAEILSNVPRC